MDNILGLHSFIVIEGDNVMTKQQELIELRQQFRELREHSKYCCQCSICRLHRAWTYCEMRKNLLRMKTNVNF